MEIIRGLFGLVVLIGIAYIFSTNKKRISWRLVGVGVFFNLINWDEVNRRFSQAS